ncbi:MAG: 2'-5' RNA ligase family protein [Nocardioidaceae bacterium]
MSAPSTIGISVAVPDPWGEQLQKYRTSLGDELASGIPSHVTLVPPFRLAPGELEQVLVNLEEAAAERGPFRIHLRGTGTFRPVSPVVFVTLAEGISGCERLATAVRRAPLEVQPEFPYHPHVTIAHHLPDPLLDQAFEEMADFECDFVVDRFSLYVRDPTSGWVPTRDFALTGRAEG